MPLVSLHEALEEEIGAVASIYEEVANTRSFTSSNDFTLYQECLLEGVLSRTWQSWNRFCREVVVESCLGTHTPSAIVAPHPSAGSVEGVSAAAIRANKGQKPVWLGANAVLRYEPTWGDIDKLLDIVDRLKPENETTLKNVCTIASPGAKILQITRNAAAHQNADTMAQLAKMGAGYKSFAVSHACQALFWIDQGSGEFLFLHAIEALKDAAVICVV